MYERLEQPEMLRSLNALHAKFYENRRRQFEEQLNPETLSDALAQRESEAERGIPIRYWSFETAVAKAAPGKSVEERRNCPSSS